jgi:hypothetical protein
MKIIRVKVKERKKKSLKATVKVLQSEPKEMRVMVGIEKGSRKKNQKRH